MRTFIHLLPALILPVVLLAACSSDDEGSAGAPDAGVTDAGTSDGGEETGCVSDADCAEDPRGVRCERASGRCVECLRNDECRSGCEQCRGGACQPIEGQCCEDADCADGRICSKAPGADSGRCGCGGDDDCRDCERCDGDGSCVLRDGACCEDGDCGTECLTCLADSPGSEGGSCVVRQGRCCEDADCPDVAAPRCDLESLRCGACLDDSVCEECRRCDVESGVCEKDPERCCGDEDCGEIAAPACDFATARCAECNDDGDCGAGFCVGGFCASCRGDRDCALGGRCEAGRCTNPASCGSDDDCGVASPCEGGRCAECTDDMGCAIGQTCGGGVCREPATCELDQNCLAGRLCLEARCEAVTCVDDRFEADDRPGAASPIYPGRTDFLQLCPNDDDYFTLPVEDGATLRLTLFFDPAEADLVPIFYFGDGGTLVGDPLENGRLLEVPLIDIDRTLRGRGLFGIEGFGTSAPYSLELELLPPESCGDDSAAEPDDDAANAGSVGVPGTQRGILCTGDADWFEVDSSALTALDLRLDNFGTGVARLTLWDSSGETVLADGEGIGGRRTLRYEGEGLGAGSVFVEVAGGRGPYELRVE